MVELWSVHSNCAEHHASNQMHSMSLGDLISEIQYSAFTRHDPVRRSIIKEIAGMFGRPPSKAGAV